jgi:hypothetical protein
VVTGELGRRCVVPEVEADEWWREVWREVWARVVVVAGWLDAEPWVARPMPKEAPRAPTIPRPANPA